MTNPHHDQSHLHGRCHCGKIVFSTPAQLDFAAARRCDCSLCRRRWAVMVSCPLDQFILEKGAESLILYQWNTAIAKHYFCKICGIYTHHIGEVTQAFMASILAVSMILIFVTIWRPILMMGSA